MSRGGGADAQRSYNSETDARAVDEPSTSGLRSAARARPSGSQSGRLEFGSTEAPARLVEARQNGVGKRVVTGWRRHRRPSPPWKMEAAAAARRLVLFAPSGRRE